MIDDSGVEDHIYTADVIDFFIVHSADFICYFMGLDAIM